MYDESDVAVGAMLGQKEDKMIHLRSYTSKTLNEGQENYTTTKKELLAVVFEIEKYRSYIIGSKVTIHSKSFCDQIFDGKGHQAANQMDIIAPRI
ncbi:Retrovirus-related Pol polyprotein from transposon 17.6 [Cucumis melo var. makuwa]|uniref:Retrovirus-related Pol polyprotein from transposon 17.6 n=1 Tax=Cucumis melo var. makuwa TaxID=1194695 RepID=A0A5A7US86_CUCMM|nr:Retrovirus-related Pol polyprotein from transposon 17.6 [Cucumis melo var. makuwa]TYK29099.1 Retrovirus-related Pol polyprotein from transposon 17.6 [Cucumis melo var. makuwa]